MTESQEDELAADAPAARDTKRWAKCGIGLILLSGVLWAPLPVIPFLPLRAGDKVILAGVLFGGVQIAWWSGAALAGPEVVRTIRAWLRSALHWKKIPRDDPQSGA